MYDQLCPEMIEIHPWLKCFKTPWNDEDQNHSELYKKILNAEWTPQWGCLVVGSNSELVEEEKRLHAGDLDMIELMEFDCRNVVEHLMNLDIVWKSIIYTL